MQRKVIATGYTTVASTCSHDNNLPSQTCISTLYMMAVSHTVIMYRERIHVCTSPITPRENRV